MSELTAQEVAELVIGRFVSNSVAFKQFVLATNGKSLDFLADVSAAIPEPSSPGISAPDGLQQSALAYLARQMANLIAPEILQANLDNEYQVAKKCRRIFSVTWTSRILARTIETRIEEAVDKDVVYHILGLTFIGEAADALIDMHLQASE